MLQVLSYRYPLKKVILLQVLYRYTATPSMVIRVTAMDTHESWQINLASLFCGILCAPKPRPTNKNHHFVHTLPIFFKSFFTQYDTFTITLNTPKRIF